MVITLSRQAEAGGEEIAEFIASRAGIRIADRTILEQIAQRSGLPIAHMALFDESVPGPIEALVVEWQTSVSQAVYMRRLVHTLLLLEREDNVLITGRGGAFVLTNPGTLHVRVIAPTPCRIARLMEREHIDRLQAERFLRRVDEDRHRFVYQAFGTDIDNPAHYDVVVNTAELDFESAAETIVRAAERKAEHRETISVTAEDLMQRVERLQRRPHEPRVSEVVWQSCQRRQRPAF